ncbi:cAMP-binding domain of CRP or a regulatory subunit of cAMP-dependent protein kinases [Nitrosomonas marina]|uniref:cAMP-binding domain of CRP or a regulatory subunit of cAMP-dependent protein kinases n=1 Tax=Nitrosomonas marina TaxID=917 RepID=A0A1I0D0B5_9PROT|nr:Crp/Fnr family transcriptional regulator [Nitrosomonas marina]SET25029.1 cAMP-binding domain of CRP or a regulatory subunit of cAMP-dependent protein kinases [Nitrosomonas marina]
MPSNRCSDTLSQSLNSVFEQNLDEWKKIYPGIREVEIPDKYFLYRQGDRDTDFFWIRKGIVKLSYLTKQGNELTLALLRQGDIIGRLQHDADELMAEESAQALGDVTCCCIGRRDFRQLIIDRPNLSLLVFESIYARQRRIEHKLRMILTQSVERRVVATLLDLAQLFSTRCTHGFSLEVFLTQQELADLVGASRSVVSTIMNDFRNRGLLDYTREQICINDSAFAGDFFDND